MQLLLSGQTLQRWAPKDERQATKYFFISFLKKYFYTITAIELTKREGGAQRTHNKNEISCILVDGFNGSFHRCIEINFQAEFVYLCREYFGKATFVDHEDELFIICSANWGWSELANERCSRV